jgi:hypothetical protein
MAIAVIAGLTFATFLTLVILPVLHSVLDDFKQFMSIHLRKAPETENEISPPRTPGRTAAAESSPEGDEREPGRELVTTG